MGINSFIMPIAAVLLIIYDIAYIAHSVIKRRFASAFGMGILLLIACAGVVIVELQYLMY